MPQIQFRLGLRPRPRWRSSGTLLPRPPSWILWVLLIRGGKGKEDRGWEWEGSERKGGQGREKGKAGGKGESAEGDRKEGRGMVGISLPHGRLRTLAALCNIYYF